VKAAAQGKRKPDKSGPAASRFLYSRPPLGDSTQVMSDSKSKANPRRVRRRAPLT
jgi:hypothetical protein